MYVILDSFITLTDIENLEKMTVSKAKYFRYDCTGEYCYTYYIMHVDNNDNIMNYIYANQLSFSDDDGYVKIKNFIEDNDRERIKSYMEMYGKGGRLVGKNMNIDIA